LGQDRLCCREVGQRVTFISLIQERLSEDVPKIDDLGATRQDFGVRSQHFDAQSKTSLDTSPLGGVLAETNHIPDISALTT
jgi:hypothetical protein